jgi:DMSO/TMAO reductase YedYZ molybdopterin-dependent catalytic subunit
MPNEFSRRKFVNRLLVGSSTVLLSGYGGSGPALSWTQVLFGVEKLTLAAQRLVVSRSELAQEYPQTALSPHFRANGSIDPDDPAYRAAAATGFGDWRLLVDGLVTQPATFSLSDLRRLPSRTQITRHDCVEGWSCIGKWTGVQLGTLLQAVGLKPNARYVVFYCADTMEYSQGAPVKYYESIDLVDAFHPQTILAYEMNDRPLPVPYGAPLRLRVERQLGYKMAKYIMRITAVDSFAQIAGGKGGFWEDRNYEWYAGI